MRFLQTLRRDLQDRIAELATSAEEQRRLEQQLAALEQRCLSRG